MLYLTVWSGSRFGLKLITYCDCVILLHSGWPSQIPDGKGVNAKKSGSGDQTYLRTECERGTAGDETNVERGYIWSLGTRLPLHVLSLVLRLQRAERSRVQY